MFSIGQSISPLRALTLGGLFSTALISGVTFADTVEIPVGSQGAAAEGSLSRGEASLSSGEASHLRGKKQEEVSVELGEPLGIQGPVGEPAITRWEYADFYVYFEYDRVLHTVKKHRG
ncbi:hypothetical protein [Microbulbifer celer]|uniref:Phosphodiesterase n=1 Tax=Microbulbifer celer TaxID=435905 RepID=A0ABW3UD02_9GAMM|nr:hypothetical protein [Microbulbifer celer]UFN58932.1 hypothetical protein LPW13_07800 [Microbulbifer celer]